MAQKVQETQQQLASAQHPPGLRASAEVERAETPQEKKAPDQPQALGAKRVALGLQGQAPQAQAVQQAQETRYV
jgi:predicted lipid-binding transport protein (Tim44 family)